MTSHLDTLNKTPGVLGSAYVNGAEVSGDFGESIGGQDAADMARAAARIWREWLLATPSAPKDAAVFVAETGRLVLRAAGSGTLLAFAENDASAGLLKLRMRDVAEQIAAETAECPGEAQSTATV
ncbi:MAG TPA: hypothetical protein VGM37_13295 [Armatimonadota bacterium]|jgi:predicted regulator of Ras-like GTPase activity (Roadblock/LC7/MglB family)